MTKGEEKVRQSRKRKLPSGTRNKLTQVRKRNQGKPKAQNAEQNRLDDKLQNSREREIADVTNRPQMNGAEWRSFLNTNKRKQSGGLAKALP